MAIGASCEIGVFTAVERGVTVDSLPGVLGHEAALGAFVGSGEATRRHSPFRASQDALSVMSVLVPL